MAIEKVNTQNERLATLGLSAFDYNLVDLATEKRVQTDLQDLLTTVAVSRARTVEDEMTPLSDMMRNRNQRLDRYGKTLAKLNKIDATFASDAKGSDKVSGEYLTEEELKVLAEIGYKADAYPSKAETQMYLQAVRSATDGLNNRSQSDITRLQSLVEKRDQTFTKAAELLKDISDSRSKLITAYGG